jgi:PAS domain S-box-containing protein
MMGERPELGLFGFARGRRSVVVAMIATALYLAAEVLASNQLSGSLAIASVIPVAAWAWAYAVRGGLVAAVAATFANVVFGTVLAGASLADWIATGGGAGSSAILGIGLLVGYLRGTRLALERELVARLAIQFDLERVSQLNESILNSVGDGIIAMTAAGGVVSINPAGRRLIGTPVDMAASEYLQHLWNLDRLDGSVPGAPEGVIADVLGDGVERITQGEKVVRPSGEIIVIDRVITPLRNTAGGDVVGVVMALRDTTERAAIERSKSEFLAMTSHELKTPLTAIHAALGLTASGLMGELPQEFSDLLSGASQNSERLLNLVSEIIELEQMNLRATTLALAAFNAKDVLEEVAAGVGPLAAKSGVNITIESDEITFEADRLRIVQTLTNLVGNAIKFSSVGGKITLSCRSIKDEVEFEVHDSGLGIDPEQASRIFEPFAQVNRSDASKLGGSGLGLAVSKGIVEQHGGRIWVDSELGQGSTFAFTLPLKQPQA